MTKPFVAFNADEVARVPGHMGVFELADGGGGTIYIGYAGGRSRFGLRGELERLLDESGASAFRYEVNTAYLTRFQELLMVFVADHGSLPPENDAAVLPRLGSLSPV